VPFKKHLAAYSLIFLFILTLSTYKVNAVSTILAVDPPTLTANVGDTFNVNINVTNVANFTSWQFTLYYLNSVLNCTAAVEGPFLQTGGGTFFGKTITNNYNSTHGRLLAYSTLLGMTSVNGSGVIAIVTFKARGGGNSPLHLADTKLGDEKIPPQPIPHTTADGIVHVTGGAHDVAVTNVAPSKTVINQNYTGNVTVTVENQGGFTETFDVMVIANATNIQTQAITLDTGNTAAMIFVWNTSGFAKGNYTLTAAAVLVGDADPGDNLFTDGWIIVSMVGDITSARTPWVPDGKCDAPDVALVAALFGANYPDPRYKANADIVFDGKINAKDVALVASRFGQKDP
jgi:hypothetical protein